MLKRQPKFVLSLFLLLSLSDIALKAQDSLVKVSMPLFVHGSFFYDFPQSFGALGGIDFPIKSKLVTVVAKNGKKELKYRDIIVAGDIGFYHYPLNNSGLYFLSSIGKRYHKDKLYYFEWLVRFGLLKTFYDGLVYNVDNNGNVNVLKDYGRYYALTGFTTVFGYNFERSKKPKPVSLDFKPSLWIQYPYNNFILPHVSAELTFKYHFNKFNIHVRQKKVVQFLRK